MSHGGIGNEGQSPGAAKTRHQTKFSTPSHVQLGDNSMYSGRDVVECHELTAVRKYRHLQFDHLVQSRPKRTESSISHNKAQQKVWRPGPAGSGTHRRGRHRATRSDWPATSTNPDMISPAYYTFELPQVQLPVDPFVPSFEPRVEIESRQHYSVISPMIITGDYPGHAPVSPHRFGASA